MSRTVVRLSASSAIVLFAALGLTAAGVELASSGADPLQSGQFEWKTDSALVIPTEHSGRRWIAVKDPSIVRYEGRWHLFCSVRSDDGGISVQYSSFADWKDANGARRHILKLNDGYFGAPQVFYFTEHRKWYLIAQAADESWEPAFQAVWSSTDDIADPESWSPLTPLFKKKPDNVKAWLDFWAICDDAKAYLFFTSLDGKMWRADTPLSKFPGGWSKPVVALGGDIFEASHTYKLKGQDKYLTVIEAQHGHGWRYQKAYIADRLGGQWRPVAADREKAFASMKNVRHTDERWTDSISHGELIRDGYDQKLEVDPAHLRFVFQGVTNRQRSGKNYGQIPWRLGMLESGLR